MKVFLFLSVVVFALQLSGDEYKGKVLWGLSTRKVSAAEIPELKGRLETGQVLRILIVTPGATGEKEGLVKGDLFLSLNNGPPDQFNISNVSGSRGGNLQVGDKIPATVMKFRDGKTMIEDLQLEVQGYYQASPQPYIEPAGAKAFLKADSVHYNAAIPVIRQNKWEHDFDDLLKRLENTDKFRDQYRLPIYSYLIRNPFKIEAVSRNIGERLRQGAMQPGQMLNTAQYLLDFAEPKHTFVSVVVSNDLNAHLDYIEKVLGECAEYNKEAFRNISPEEREFVLANREKLLDSFFKYKMLSYEPDTKLTSTNLRLCSILNRIDRQALFAQARLASTLVSDTFTASLLREVGSDTAKPIIAERDTPYGKIVIAGTVDNIHTVDCAVIYDLGGNDLYLNNQAGSVPGKIPTAIIVDYAGNDSYESTDPLTQGAGNFGVGILRDLAGNDQYVGIRAVQGSAFGGIGMLIDEDGDDTYRAMTMAQGAAFFGAGILADRRGNDRYEAHQCAQAVGFTGGAGLLLDFDGDDSYYCKGSQQTGYQTRGHFEGWGQGIGIGMRPYTSGGTGVLYDAGGRNRFEAGTFSQGGGYYYAYGLLYKDGDGDDLYIGTRYAQGFGVHQALGAFIEAGGNDTYRTTHAVAQGLAWDEAVGLFIDEKGDDKYDGGTFFSLGAVSHNALCLFWDRGGRDHYARVKTAYAGNNAYHGGTSLSIFIDDGGDEDIYIERRNNTAESGPQNFIFIDR